MTATTDLNAVVEVLRSADRFLVTSHENPDGDALGSLLAMHLALAELGKVADVVITILPTSAIVEKVLFAPDGVAGTLRKGSVVIDGEDTSKVKITDLARKIGYVFQNPDHQLLSFTASIVGGRE